MEDIKDVAEHMSQFYSFSGRKLAPNIAHLSKILMKIPTKEYTKPNTPAYFRVSHIIRK
jgi:hypothetical protein